MYIWLITVGEPLPIDGPGDRLLRGGILANMLVERGHKVVWWTSTFDHVRKRFRFNKDVSVEINRNLKLMLLHSVRYKKNVSVARIINHYGIARKFKRLSEMEVKPDIVLCSLPTLELSLAATRYGRDNKVPVILDIRDLWPDIFLEIVPKWGQWLARLFLSPMFRTLMGACAGATAISGVTPQFVEWGVKHAKRNCSPLDRDFPMGYSESFPDIEDIQAAENFWRNYGITKETGEFVICFFGTFGRQFNLETVIEAARSLKSRNLSIRFVLCGSGDNLKRYKQLSKDCENVIFPGWVRAAEIWSLMRISALGLAPYVDNENFTMNLPNKPLEYFSAGLPIVSSINGFLGELISKHSCGVTYHSAEELLSVLIELYNKRDKLKWMSQNASYLYQQKFVAEKVYNDMIDYLESVITTYKKSGDVVGDKLLGCN